MRSDLPPPSDPSAPADPRDAFFDVRGLKRGMGRRVGNASVFVLLISMTKVVLLFGGIAITARLIPPAEYGIFALAMPVVAVGLSLTNFGLPQAIVQQKTITHAEVSTLFWANAGFASLGALAIFASAGWAAEIFHQPEVANVYRVTSIVVVLAAILGQYGAMMRRRLQIAQFEALMLIGEAAGVAVAVATALMGWSYWALVAQQIAVQGVPVVLAVTRIGWLPSGPHKARLGEVTGALSFGGYIAGMGIMNRLMSYTGTLIAGAQLGTTAAGLYGRAVRIGNIPPLRIMQPLSGTIMPALSRLQDDPEAMRAMFVRMISRANLLLVPVAVIMAAGAAPIVTILLGPKWTEATPLMFWMSLMTLRASANHGLRYALLAHGKSREIFFNTLARFIVVIATLYFSAPYGLVTMTASYMLVETFITLPMMMHLALRFTPLNFGCILRASLDGMVFAVVLTAALIIFVNPWLSREPALVQLIGICLLTGLAYAGRVAISPELRQDVLSVLRQVLSRLPGRGGKPAE